MFSGLFSSGQLNYAVHPQILSCVTGKSSILNSTKTDKYVMVVHSHLVLSVVSNRGTESEYGVFRMVC